jgi:uncharacterized protein (DUF58 family)
MGDIFHLFLLVLLFLAISLREDFVFILLYLLTGAYILGRLWGRSALKGVSVRRIFSRRAFLGEVIQVDLEIINHRWLPLAWLQVREQLPVELRGSDSINQVSTIAPKGVMNVTYSLSCRRRGYYPIGPLDMFSSDLLGLIDTQRMRHPEEYLTVYPRIVPLTSVKVPSNAPLGTLRHRQPIFEDPSRVLSKRDYVAGDSLRRVDWKSSAITGRLQVKLYEPSIALETMIFLNLRIDDFMARRRFDVAELSIVVAASLANWIVDMRQSVGFATNGGDPILNGDPPPVKKPARGRENLLGVLETLARIRVASNITYPQLIQSSNAELSWGTTLILVTCLIDEELFKALFQARRLGLNAFLVQCGPAVNYQEIRKQAGSFGIPITQIHDENDLDLWRS